MLVILRVWYLFHLVHLILSYHMTINRMRMQVYVITTWA